VLQEIVQDWKAGKQGEIRQELETVTYKLEKCKVHIRILTSMFVDMLEPLVKPEDQEERESEERLMLMAGIQGMLIGKLETAGREAEMDLSGEIGKIKAWGGRFSAFPAEIPANLVLPRLLHCTVPSRSCCFIPPIHQETEANFKPYHPATNSAK